MIEEGLVEFSFGGCSEGGDVVGYFYVAHGGERGKKIEALEDEADLGAAHFSALAVGEFGEVSAADKN